MNDFFNTLGIEATKEEKEIKKAYREEAPYCKSGG